jgi:hypothetical protein
MNGRTLLRSKKSHLPSITRMPALVKGVYVTIGAVEAVATALNQMTYLMESFALADMVLAPWIEGAVSTFANTISVATVERVGTVDTSQGGTQTWPLHQAIIHATVHCNMSAEIEMTFG